MPRLTNVADKIIELDKVLTLTSILVWRLAHALHATGINPNDPTQLEKLFNFRNKLAAELTKHLIETGRPLKVDLAYIMPFLIEVGLPANLPINIKCRVQRYKETVYLVDGQELNDLTYLNRFED